jgi:anti-sigma B factor antagonist
VLAVLHAGTGRDLRLRREVRLLTEQIVVRVTTAAGHPVVAVSGEVDVATAPVLRDGINAVIADGARHLIVNLEGVDFMDSAALNLLIAAHRELGPGSMGVVISRANLGRLFAVSGIDAVIPVFESLDAAVEAASKSDSG